MRWITAKIGTHASQRILLLKGSLLAGAWVEWSEDGRRQHSRRQTGIINKINPWGLVFIERM